MIYERLQLREICEKIDLLTQRDYSDSRLPPIYGAGSISTPKIAFVFINPTYRNVSSGNSWEGLRAPWIGVKNIWRMFGEAGVLTEQEVQATQQDEWSNQFALDHYSNLAKKGYYVTNLVKWTGRDAKLPDGKKISAYKQLLKEELEIIKPQITLAFGQLTFAALIPEKRNERLSFMCDSMLDSGELKLFSSEDFKNVLPSYFPVGQGIKNWDKAVSLVKMAVSAIA